MIRAEQRLARDSTEADATVVAGYEFGELATVAAIADGLAALVTLYTCHLPPAEDFVGDSAFVQKLLALPNW